MSAATAGAIVYGAGPEALYLNITNRCSSACTFCLRSWCDGLYGESLRLRREPEADEVTQAIELAFADEPAGEVVFCGFGEPTLRLDVVLAVTEWLHLRRIPSRLDTNGHGALLNPDVDVPAALAAAGLRAVSVSLNAADPITYDAVCRPTFAKAYRAVLRFAEQCQIHDIDTTLTTVTHPEVDPDAVQAIAQALGVGFRARRLASPAGRDITKEGNEP
jgi:GTP 3',8-cyclase